ncbi:MULTISPECIES: hypothetical protein [unclassified Actinoplanes]|uniref:hypothetical protein n=1 Tax=unclassified Actinoplanes TaxID=2626549 RepID=UPI0005BDEE4D|nr:MULTISPECIES: hypothetical protein [unclassified Actinoplanes]
MSLLLDQVRGIGLRNPAHAAEHLLSLLAAGPYFDRGIEAELWILLAELLNQQDDITTGLTAVHRAAQLLETDARTDWSRLITLLGVSADLSVQADDSSAVEVCDHYLSVITNTHAADPQRLITGRALRAAAAYHRRCDYGRSQLDSLCRVASRHSPMKQMLEAGVEAMRDRCRGVLPPTPTRIPALPGGLLNPHLSRADPDFFAYRIWHVRTRGHHCD